ncbi:MAG: 16S rRNA (cytidine(1402)-2'-O)-methyltransferase [Gammaproteobacteria bacterium]|nr:16S rRNA (cytidine(1402)-2'-O)-methyltransferase [Gammaproteobacteria bacterium]
MTARAIEVLRDADVIAAEDTRHSRRLLQHFGIATPMLSLHDHNERKQCENVVARLLQGQTVALISDAGTPLISDPGFRLVRSARAAGVPVKAVPGPCAVTAALSIAGLPTDRFVFEGFLDNKAGARRARLEELASEARTIVIYASPRRLQAELQAVADVMGEDRPAVLLRELTKAFESSYGSTIGELLQLVRVDADMQKGEMVLLLGGAQAVDDTAATDRLLAALLAELPLKTAVSVAAQATGVARNTLYQRALEFQHKKPPDDA